MKSSEKLHNDVSKAENTDYIYTQTVITCTYLCMCVCERPGNPLKIDKNEQ